MSAVPRTVRFFEPFPESKPTRYKRGRPLYLGSFRQAERMARLGFEIARGKTITTAYIRSLFAVSTATAKRDLIALERALGLRGDRKSGPQPPAELRAPADLPGVRNTA